MKSIAMICFFLLSGCAAMDSACSVNYNIILTPETDFIKKDRRI